MIWICSNYVELIFDRAHLSISYKHAKMQFGWIFSSDVLDPGGPPQCLDAQERSKDEPFKENYNIYS